MVGCRRRRQDGRVLRRARQDVSRASSEHVHVVHDGRHVHGPCGLLSRVLAPGEEGEGESGCRGDRRRRGGSADHSHVILEVAGAREGDAALVALEGLLARVRAPGEEGGGRVGLPWERRPRGDPGTPITHICRVRELPVAKATPHSSHLKGFSPVCVRLGGGGRESRAAAETEGGGVGVRITHM